MLAAGRVLARADEALEAVAAAGAGIPTPCIASGEFGHRERRSAVLCAL